MTYICPAASDIGTARHLDTCPKPGVDATMLGAIEKSQL